MDFSLLLALRLPGQFLQLKGQTLQRIDTGTFAHVALFSSRQFGDWFGGMDPTRNFAQRDLNTHLDT